MKTTITVRIQDVTRRTPIPRVMGEFFLPWKSEDHHIGFACNRGIIRAFGGLSEAIRTKIVDAADALVRDVGGQPLRFTGKEREDGGFAVFQRGDVRGEDVDGIATAAEKYLHDDREVGIARVAVEKVVGLRSRIVAFMG